MPASDRARPLLLSPILPSSLYISLSLSLSLSDKVRSEDVYVDKVRSDGTEEFFWSLKSLCLQGQRLGLLKGQSLPLEPTLHNWKDTNQAALMRSVPTCRRPADAAAEPSPSRAGWGGPLAGKSCRGVPRHACQPEQAQILAGPGSPPDKTLDLKC